jgi:hypothetical protein
MDGWQDRALDGMELELDEREADDPVQQERDKPHKQIGKLSAEDELRSRGW